MKQHFIYVIGREEGPVKVGITCAPERRLATIQTGCPFKIEILHLRKCFYREHALEHEESFHRVYREHRLAGEWFDLEADLAIEGVDTGFEFEAHFAYERWHYSVCAYLNIWPWAGEEVAHDSHS